ncbi:GntR family transcriptional regulator [Noviherbaspirillum galbum]|uniref:GntR family transcriptional regulator n=1 Tax=Noviherbaspirillum galbum TaxID=2709383 RepID=A0A6B3SXA8_9BURK|nr:GntR family transcriptional regulator [Noviherbaspirillum galbum]NEX63112.1 GntR family transcriptional regulator [Noviherbaspirillum galbum]
MKKLSDLLREKIEERIVTGDLAPGASLDETALAEEFGASRTPLREAFIQLASSGLIILRPRRSAIVAQIGPQQLVEMFEVMAEFEAMCGRLAARRMSPAEHAALLSAHDACRAARDMQDPDEYYYRNEVFHSLIYAGSHNAFLAEQAQNLYRRLSPYRRLQLRVRGRIGNSFDEHDAVVKAILEGRGDDTAELLRRHVAIQGQRFADLVATLNTMQQQAASA